MNIPEAVQVFVLIYELVMGALYFSARYWVPLLAKTGRALGLMRATTAQKAPPATADAAPLSYSFRPGAPRPPRLRRPPTLNPDGPEARLAYCRRLGLAARLVGFVASANPTGLPLGLFREWHESRWQAHGQDCGISHEDALSEALRELPEDEAAYASTMTEFASRASYDELADIVHFCGEAFAAAKAGSMVRARIIAMADQFAVAMHSDSSDPGSIDEQDRLLLERRLEVDFLSVVDEKVAHLRRMHAFFRGRLIELRDRSDGDRREERMAGCRRHMEEHEKLLACFGAAP